MKTHIYESSLPEFLEWSAWVYENCNPAEIEIFLEDSEVVSEEKNNLYERWITDQQITKHTIMEDDVVIFEKNYN